MSFMCLASPIDFILFHLLFLIKYADMLLFLSTALMTGLAGDCKQDKNLHCVGVCHRWRAL
jgi:hypothetical protein